MHQPSRRSLLRDVSKELGKPYQQMFGGFAASSELRLQDVFADQRSRRATGDVGTHGSHRKGEECHFSLFASVELAFQELGSRSDRESHSGASSKS